MSTVIRIIPRTPRLVADVTREARQSGCVVKVIRNNVVMLPRKPAQPNYPEAA